jgi:hypothetical protein
MLFIVVIASGCANLLSAISGQGSLSLSISSPSSSARAIVPSASDYASTIKSYKITVTGNGNTYKSTTVTTVSSTSVLCTMQDIAAGSYTISVAACGDAASTILVATGSSSVTITAGATQSAAVSLIFTQSAVAGATNAGGISLPISWPTSTALSYVYAVLDGATGSPIVPAVTTGTAYSATISASKLAGGTHLLAIYFRSTSSSGTTLGPYYESVYIWDGVTDTTWADSSGGQQTSLSFTADEFASSNAKLAGLSCATTDATPASIALSPAFAAGTTSYSLSTGFTSTAFAFSATAVVGSQDLSCTWNGTTQPWSSITGSTYTFTVSSLTLTAGTNTLAIIVTAPDRQTTQTYTVTVSCGAAGITISPPTNPTYLGLGFAASASIIQGQSFALETGNTTLADITSGWTWYLDGVTQSERSQRFVLVPATTYSLLGSYSISAAIASGGVSYSGRLLLTVGRPTALNLTSPTATPITLTESDGTTTITQGTPYDICYCSGKLYMADMDNHRIIVANTDGTGASVLAGGALGNVDGTGTGASFGFPFSLACDGKYLYVGDTTNVNIRKIALATGVVTTLVSTGISEPSGLWTDGVTLYMCDKNTNLVSAIDIASKSVTTLAGSGSAACNDGTGTGASFNQPYRICGDGSNLYVTEYGSGAVRKIVVATPTMVTTIVSSGLTHPAGITYDGTYLYLCDADASRIVRLTLGGTVTAIVAGLAYPKGITTDGSKLYIEDTNNHVVKVIQ